MYFHHREGLDVHAGAALFQPADHLQIMLEGQVGMQPADNVKFSGAFANTLFRALINFIESKSVSARRIRIAAESAKSAMRHANIRRIDVAIDVVIGGVPVAL